MRRADRDSMTWMDADAPALGGEERSDEAPRAGAGSRGQADPAPVRRRAPAADPRGGGPLYSNRRGRTAASP